MKIICALGWTSFQKWKSIKKIISNNSIFKTYFLKYNSHYDSSVLVNNGNGKRLNVGALINFIHIPLKVLTCYVARPHKGFWSIPQECSQTFRKLSDSAGLKENIHSIHSRSIINAFAYRRPVRGFHPSISRGNRRAETPECSKREMRHFIIAAVNISPSREDFLFLQCVSYGVSSAASHT